MKKTFCILAHKITNALEFTVDYFSSFDENTILIHIDKKSNFDDFLYLEKMNVHLVKNREDIHWGGISMVKATLTLMRLFNKEGYFFLISGEDFPAMSNSEINFIINQNEGRNFIHFQDGRNRYIDPKVRFKINYPEMAFKKDKSFFNKVLLRFIVFLSLNKNRKGLNYIQKENIKLVKGSQWFAFNSLTVNEILTFLDNNPIYVQVFERSFCPDEMFFQTLINHLKCKRFSDETKMNDCLRYLDWKTGPDYPKILDISDFPAISKSGSMFARKASPMLNSSDFARLVK